MMRVMWSHLSMKAYEYFLVCSLCGSMVHDSPTSKHQHEVWHENVAAAMVILLDESEDAASIDAVMAAWFARHAIFPSGSQV